MVEADFAQPRELGLDVEQLVRRVFVNDPESLQELRVQAWRGRSNVLEVAEHATRRKAIEDLGVQRALPRVREVVDREAGDHSIELAIERWKRYIEVVTHDFNRWVGRESFL